MFYSVRKNSGLSRRTKKKALTAIDQTDKARDQAIKAVCTVPMVENAIGTVFGNKAEGKFTKEMLSKGFDSATAW